MKILIIGSGGREHALGWKLKKSSRVNQIYFAPGNGGTTEVGENIDISSTDVGKLLDFALEKKIDLTVVGPEAPLVDGIVDVFKSKKLKIIGPSKKASQIESSKIFAKKLMAKYKIPTAPFIVFSDFNKAKKYLKNAAYPLVVKADGLCTGKGVAVCSNYQEAKDFSRKLMIDKIFGPSGEKIIIETCLVGNEVSFMVLTDGTNFSSFIPSQDHKRLLDEDRGPNTGGMGAYAPVPFVDKKLIGKIEKEIVAPTIDGMKKEGCPYQGILYPGLILTKDGPKVLEYNCRFGDPETQPLMMMLRTDLYQALVSTIEKKVKKQKLSFKSGASVCIVLAADSYPGHYKKGEKISGLRKVNKNNIKVFHAGTSTKNGEIITSGGRVLGVTSYGKNIKEALKNVYQAIGKKGVYFKNMHYRKDIGAKAISNKK